jgi:hypothetical protein
LLRLRRQQLPLEIDGTTYEAIPEAMIVRAGLAAASTLISA